MGLHPLTTICALQQAPCCQKTHSPCLSTGSGARDRPPPRNLSFLDVSPASVDQQAIYFTIDIAPASISRSMQDFGVFPSWSGIVACPACFRGIRGLSFTRLYCRVIPVRTGTRSGSTGLFLIQNATLFKISHISRNRNPGDQSRSSQIRTTLWLRRHAFPDPCRQVTEISRQPEESHFAGLQGGNQGCTGS